MEQQIEISGMSCVGCVNNVKKAFEQLAGVDSVEVNLNPPHAIITSDRNYSNEELSTVLKNAGNYSIAGNKTNEQAPKSGGSCCS